MKVRNRSAPVEVVIRFLSPRRAASIVYGLASDVSQSLPQRL